MGRSKRNILATARESAIPPEELTADQAVARLGAAQGNNLYACSLPNGTAGLFELAQRFRNTVWIKRGGFVLVRLTPSEEPNRRVQGEIIRVVHSEKEWRKMPYWPKEFPKIPYDEDEEETTCRDLPLPSD